MRSVDTYKWLEEKNTDAIFVFSVLGLGHPESFPRYRDCYCDGKAIVVWSRMGAGNAKCWEKTIEGKKPKNCNCPACTMKKIRKTHPNYLRRRKWKGDSTYVAYYFSIPEKWYYDIQYLQIGHHQYASPEYKKLVLSIAEKEQKREVFELFYPKSESR